jgi:hypothetical protein
MKTIGQQIQIQSMGMDLHRETPVSLPADEESHQTARLEQRLLPRSALQERDLAGIIFPFL